jgi:hypothetical protein
MSIDAYFGAPGSDAPSGYVNFVGAGEVTVNVAGIGGDEPCAGNPGICLLRVASVDYTFAPEPDPATLGGALTLLGGGLLVLRGRRSRAEAANAW